MRAAEAAAVGAVLAAFAAAEWAAWLGRRTSPAQEAVPPARALVTWAYTDVAPATEAEGDYSVHWNATGLAWAGDAVWRIHRVVDSEDSNVPLRPCPLRVTRERPRLTGVDAPGEHALRLEYSDAVVVDGGRHDKGEPGPTTVWDDARAWLAVHPPPWVEGDDSIHCGASWDALVGAVRPPRALPAPLDRGGASALEVWTTSSADAVWSGRVATDAWPLASAQRLSVTAVTGHGRAVDVSLDAVAVARCCCADCAPGVSESTSVWVRHPGLLLSASSAAGVRAWRDAWPPHGPVVDGAPLVTDMRCGCEHASAEDDRDGVTRSATGGGGSTAASMTARERWVPAVVHIEDGPFDPALADFAPHRASVHLYADRALQLWRAAQVPSVDRAADPTVLAVDRVSWWRSSRDGSAAGGPVARAVVELVWWVEGGPATPRMWHRALVDVVDSQIHRLDARIRSTGASAGHGGRDALPLLAVVLRRSPTDGACPAAVAAQTASSPSCDIDLSTAVDPARALLACLEGAARAQPVVVWAGACAAVALRDDDRARFVVEHALAYIPLLPRPRQRGDPPCREPLEGADVERCCADEPVWLHGWLPAVVLAAGDLHRLASSAPAGHQWWTIDGIAAALRAAGVDVLRVPHPTVAGLDVEAAGLSDEVTTAPSPRAPCPVLSTAVAGGARATSTMASTSGHAPAHAVDQDPYTFFWAEGRLAVNDTLEVVWPAPIAVTSLEVYTGSWRYPTHWLRDGIVEVAASVDPDVGAGAAEIVWTRLSDLTVYHNGVYRAWFAAARQVQALRIRATEPQDGLAVEDVYISLL